MIKPSFFKLQPPKEMIGDTTWELIRQYANRYNNTQTELTEQVRLKVWNTLNRLACYFAQAWKAGETTGFSFFLTRSYNSGEKHPAVRAGLIKQFCSNKTVYNHIERLVKAGILSKESMKEHTKKHFRGGKRAISCLMLTWSAAIITLMPKEAYSMPENAPLTHAEMVLYCQKLTEKTVFKRL